MHHTCCCREGMETPLTRSAERADQVVVVVVASIPAWKPWIRKILRTPSSLFTFFTHTPVVSKWHSACRPDAGWTPGILIFAISPTDLSAAPCDLPHAPIPCSFVENHPYFLLKEAIIIDAYDHDPANPSIACNLSSLETIPWEYSALYCKCSKLPSRRKTK